MIKSFYRSILTLSIIFAYSNSSHAQGSLCIDGQNTVTGKPCLNTIATAVPFLRITPDAKGSGMGDVGIATEADASSIYYNAAKTVFAKSSAEVGLTYTPWLKSLNLDDVFLAHISGYKKLDEFQAISGSLRYFSLGQIDFTDDQGTAIGGAKPREMELAAAYSRKLSDRLGLGLTLKYIHSKIANGVYNGEDIKPINAVAADISFFANAPLGNATLNYGAAITNIGPKVSYTDTDNKDFMPTNLGIGATYNNKIDDQNRFSFGIDLNKLLVPTPPDSIEYDDQNVPTYKDQSVVGGIFSSFGDAPGGGAEELREIMISLGGEYWYDEQFALRLGYFHEHASKGDRKYFTLGAGVKYSMFGLDLSYLVPTSKDSQNPLKNTIRFGLSLDFDEVDAATTAPTETGAINF